MMMKRVVEETEDEERAALADLKKDKNNLKRQLQQFEVDFYKEHGRMPEKRDKESVRHLYERFKAVRNQINARKDNRRSENNDNALSRNTHNDSTSSANKIAALKKERKMLNLMIRNFEDDFYRKNNRKVSSLDDTLPMATYYRRYITVKKAIASIEGLEQETNEEMQVEETNNDTSHSGNPEQG
mmetsp:Transcript_11263/g.23712  ORF Transcript_11263/g.23712 Transcript_11263/m.23712 type:complete len:185 (-) Transcript_11263:221-775(-)|eukprot:CAMPEP_0171337076 /NCGR_PEP_ID=MMETSP0878-20121228/6468_1 /TAXON_ID=67004 /ORGANISM="Thalassiosira weissflogii, Strain CCMP1336" /LENGTH=184 /DNA_ID=CAMNT_0011838665 /DNA_START=124 /DNA_END=678 /DNA_ORIENTATION=+